jgi:hypothetical protein
MKIEIADLTGVECGDIAITAAEGGIGYWSQILKYEWERWQPSLHVIEVPDDFVFYTIRYENPVGKGEIESEITPELLRRGFEVMAKAPLDKGGWPVPKLLGMAREDCTGEIDSDIADMLVQFGVFGEVVFG